MKTNKKLIATVLLLIFIQSIIVLGTITDDNTYRTKIRYNASLIGIELSNVWTRVDSDRRLVMFGGTLRSTQQLQRLFNSVTNLMPFIENIQQDIKTPEPSPYPQSFSVGFDPYRQEKSEKDD